MRKSFVIIVTCLIQTTALFSYTYTFYNTTNKSVWIDPFWNIVSFPKEKMFSASKPEKEFDSSISHWEQANQIKGPIKLLPHKEYTFKFSSWWDSNMCINSFQLGWQKNNLKSSPIKTADIHTYKRIKKTGHIFNKKFSQNNSSEKGSCGKKAEKIISTIPKANKDLPCNNMNILIATNRDGNLVTVIRQ